MDPVEALNRVFPEPDDLDGKLESAQSYAEQCRLHLQKMLQSRPDISEIRIKAISGPQQFERLSIEVQKLQDVGQTTLKNVESTTSEIKRLDTAKDNLIVTIRMLRQLKMLTRLYLQLDSLLKEKRYEDMTGSVKAASDLIDYFRHFRSLPQISQISREIGQMEIKIYDQVQEDFQFAMSSEGSIPADTLRAACVVLSSLDSATEKPVNQDKLRNWYCDNMLAEYSRIYSPNDEAGSLENIKRRFTYLKNKVILRHMSIYHAYFPGEWEIQPQLVTAACQRTVNDLVSQIKLLKSTEPEDIKLLLSTLQETIEFEKFSKTQGQISDQCIPYLFLWVEFQDRQLKRRVDGYAKTLAPPEEQDDVIPSSKDLVNFYRALLTQLTKLKHLDETVLQLANIMARHLGQYAIRVLLAYLPSSIHTFADVKLAGIVETTAEYVMTTTRQLERNIEQMLSASGDNETVDSNFEKVAITRFRHVEIKVEDLFVQYIQRSIEPLWIEYAQFFAAQRGARLDVSRTSPLTTVIVSQLNAIFTDVFTAAPLPATIYGVSSRAVDIICIGFLTVVMARIPKPVSEPQVEQMLLDFGTIRSQSLLKLIDLMPANVKEKKGAQRLERLLPKVIDSLGQAEAVLKVLMTPSKPMDVFVQNYQLLIKDRSTLNFRKVLEVKGVRFQNDAISQFKLIATQDVNLIAENAMLRQISTVPPLSNTSSPFDAAPFNGNGNGAFSSGGFNMNQFKKLGDLLRRDH